MWNAKLYDTFGKERMQPSIDLANRINKACVRILDVGCGSGMSTLALKNRFPEAEIIGVDLSAAMLENAKKLLPDVQWIQRDCSESLEDLGQFDLVFSNAFLQWLPDQEKFIKNIRSCTKENGILALQIPNFEAMKIAGIIKEVAKEFYSNGDIFNDMSDTCYNHLLAAYYSMMCKYYSDVEVWQTNYIHQMDSSDAIVEFVKSTALIPYLERLSEVQEKDFLAQLQTRTAEYYKPCDNGKVLFPFERIFVQGTNLCTAGSSPRVIR